MVQGIYVMHMPAVGGLFLWIQNNWIIVLIFSIAIIMGMTITKYIFDKQHNRAVLERYIEKRDALEVRHEQRYLNYKRQQDIEELDDLLNTKRE